jgi:hypothetical protein
MLCSMVLLMLGGCESARPTPPATFPLTLVAGHRMHGEFRVLTRDLHSVELDYLHHTDDKRSLAQWRSVGSTFGTDLTLKVVMRALGDPGIPVLDREIRQPMRVGYGASSISTELVRAPLAPGAYAVDVIVIHADPSYATQPVRVQVVETYTGK